MQTHLASQPEHAAAVDDCRASGTAKDCGSALNIAVAGKRRDHLRDECILLVAYRQGQSRLAGSQRLRTETKAAVSSASKDKDEPTRVRTCPCKIDEHTRHCLRRDCAEDQTQSEQSCGRRGP